MEITPRNLKEYYEKEALLIEDHQKQLYLGNPWSRYRHGSRLKYVLEILNSLKFNTLLDVGCAEGFCIKIIKNKFNLKPNQIVGLDISRNYILKAKNKGRCSLLIVGDANNLPLKDKSFDLVLCQEVLEHILTPKKALEELMRVSKKYIILTVAGENPFHYTLRKIRLLKPKNPFREVGHGHINEIRVKETVIPWALSSGWKCEKTIITCYLPISFLEKHKFPTILLPLIKLADKIISKIPVIKDFGATQIVLLEKEEK